MLELICVLILLAGQVGGRPHTNNYPWLGAECWSQGLVGYKGGSSYWLKSPKKEALGILRVRDSWKFSGSLGAGE